MQPTVVTEQQVWSAFQEALQLVTDEGLDKRKAKLLTDNCLQLFKRQVESAEDPSSSAQQTIHDLQDQSQRIEQNTLNRVLAAREEVVQQQLSSVGATERKFEERIEAHRTEDGTFADASPQEIVTLREAQLQLLDREQGKLQALKQASQAAAQATLDQVDACRRVLVDNALLLAGEEVGRGPGEPPGPPSSEPRSLLSALLLAALGGAVGGLHLNSRRRRAPPGDVVTDRMRVGYGIQHGRCPRSKARNSCPP